MLKSSIGILCLLCKDTNNIQKTYWEFNPKSLSMLKSKYFDHYF